MVKISRPTLLHWLHFMPKVTNLDYLDPKMLKLNIHKMIFQLFRHLVECESHRLIPPELSLLSSSKSEKQNESKSKQQST